MNKKICVLVMAIFSVSFHAMGADVGNLNEFKSVAAVPGGIRMTFQDVGSRFSYQIGDEERKISAYGESVVILNGQSADFATKHTDITIAPVKGNPGSFLVNKNWDLRSMGGEVGKESFTLSVESGTVVYGRSVVSP